MKVAIVTGASQGIGACVAEGLAEDGYSVVLIARSKNNLENVAAQIKEKTPEISTMICPLDVQDHNAVKKTVSDISSRFGRVDLLFNNAGISTLGSLDVSIEEFEQVLSVNLTGQFSFLKAIVPIMKKQKQGTVINVASRAGKIGFAEWGAYVASKFGLVGLGESLYHELSPLGIKVTTLCPSWVDTEMAKDSGLAPDEMIHPDDILKAVRWLLSLSPAAVVKELIIECRLQTY